MSLRGGVRCIDVLCIFPLFGGFLCICTHMYTCPFGPGIESVGHSLTYVTMLVMHGKRLFQATNFGPVRSLCQERFSGEMPRTQIIVTCLGQALL
jgi:hypothetical protein